MAEPGVESGPFQIPVWCLRHTEEALPAWEQFCAGAPRCRAASATDDFTTNCSVFCPSLSSSCAALLCFIQQFPQRSGIESCYLLLFAFRLWSCFYPYLYCFDLNLTKKKTTQKPKQPPGKHVKLHREKQIIFFFGPVAGGYQNALCHIQ